MGRSFFLPIRLLCARSIDGEEFFQADETISVARDNDPASGDREYYTQLKKLQILIVFQQMIVKMIYSDIYKYKRNLTEMNVHYNILKITIKKRKEERMSIHIFILTVVAGVISCYIYDTLKGIR